MARPSLKVTTSKPGSDVAGETAAALAAGSIIFKDIGKFFVLDVFYLFLLSNKCQQSTIYYDTKQDGHCISFGIIDLNASFLAILLITLAILLTNIFEN